jgi:tetratricopeptide (TPR) repeat protein
MLNTSLYQQRQFEAQLTILETGARDCPNLLPVVNNYAWALATLPEAKLRDGAKAIKLIRNVIAKPDQRSPAFLDTLAAGLAEEGKFDEAIEMQTEVIKMLREAGASEDVMRQFIQHLDTYRSSLPLRDPPV